VALQHAARRSRSRGRVSRQAERSPRPDDRRSDIIAAAIRVIARDGIRACTVSALEAATGFARGHFTYHFRSKEEIIGLAFATVASDWATMQIAATAGESALARLEARVRAAIDWAVQCPEYFRCLMNFRVEMMRNPSAFPLATRIRAQLWDFGAQMIAEGVAVGALQPRCDPVTESRIVFATVDGFLLHATMDASFCPSDRLADHVWAVVRDRLCAGPSRPS
jgi:AcrR family transcriptional regulator